MHGDVDERARRLLPRLGPLAILATIRGSSREPEESPVAQAAREQWATDNFVRLLAAALREHGTAEYARGVRDERDRWVYTCKQAPGEALEFAHAAGAALVRDAGEFVAGAAFLSELVLDAMGISIDAPAEPCDE